MTLSELGYSKSESQYIIVYSKLTKNKVVKNIEISKNYGSKWCKVTISCNTSDLINMNQLYDMQLSMEEIEAIEKLRGN